MHRGAWHSTIHRVAQSWPWLNRLSSSKQQHMYRSQSGIQLNFFRNFFKETACVLIQEERWGQMGNGERGAPLVFAKNHSPLPLLWAGALVSSHPLSCTSFSLLPWIPLTLTSSNWTELTLTLQLGEDSLKLTLYPFPLICISSLNKIEEKPEQLGPWRNKSPQGWGQGRQKSLNQVQWRGRQLQT